MPIVNRVADLHDEITAWRRDLHAHPELQYDVHRTAGAVSEKLKSFGCDEVVTGIGRTGVVGVIRGRKPGAKVIGMRADMDALPIEEATTVAYKSTVPGKMHACGHDGHTAMLLGAAKYLAETRNFAGTAVVIFQPAEEGGAGARAMMDDGLFDRFGIEEVFGMHNYPGMPIGQFAIRSGPMMASTDTISIDLEGVGGHAAWPHFGVDTVLVGAQIVNQLQSIVARNVDPLQAAVISICTFQAGNADNVIPQQAKLRGTARALSPKVRDLLQKRVREVVEGTARAYGAKAELTYTTGYPVLVNDPELTQRMLPTLKAVAGDAHVVMLPLITASDDFTFFSQKVPGMFINVGITPLDKDPATAPANHSPLFYVDETGLTAGVRVMAQLAVDYLR